MRGIIYGCLSTLALMLAAGCGDPDAEREKERQEVPGHADEDLLPADINDIK